MQEVKANFDACLILQYNDNSINKPFLYLGSQASARVDPKVLRDTYNIGYILNVTDDIDNFHITNTENIIVYKRIPIKDDPNEHIERYFEESHNFLQEVYNKYKTDTISAPTGILVHCNAGISRSASIVISYLCKYRDMTLLESWSHTKSKRKQASPNLGFIKKLIQFELDTKKNNYNNTRFSFNCCRLYK